MRVIKRLTSTDSWLAASPSGSVLKAMKKHYFLRGRTVCLVREALVMMVDPTTCHEIDSGFGGLYGTQSL